MTTTNTPATTGASNSIIAHQLGYLPNVRRYEHGGVHCVAVSLSGLHGAGREMLLDEADWRHVSEDISPWWQIQRMPGGDYVVSSTGKAIEIAQRTAKTRMLFLGRYLAQPAPGLFVRFANGNTLDCRRTNLAVMTRSEHAKANMAAVRIRKMQHWAETAAAMAAANATAQVTV